MIHDAKIEISCDGCWKECVYVEPPYVYQTFSGKGGKYVDDEAQLREQAAREEPDWKFCEDGDFCPDCRTE